MALCDSVCTGLDVGLFLFLGVYRVALSHSRRAFHATTRSEARILASDPIDPVCGKILVCILRISIFSLFYFPPFPTTCHREKNKKTAIRL